MRKNLLILATILGLFGIVYGVFFYKNDEARIRERIDGIAAAGSFSEGTNPAMYGINLKAGLKEAMAPGATIDAAELGGASLGPDEAVGAGARLAGQCKSAKIAVVDLRIRVTKDTATAEGRVVFTGNEHGTGVRVEQRKAQFELAKIDGEWKVTRIVLAPAV